MTIKTYQQEMYNKDNGAPSLAYMVTLGTVVDTNDPQQSGRVRAACPILGDILQAPVEDIPWAIYVSPLAGQVAIGTRGPGIQTSEGGVAYGMWAIPKVGAKVLVVCIDGDPRKRAYIGSTYGQFTTHTLPHGRWFYDDHPALPGADGTSAPYGPFTSREQPIQPLADNLKQAFGTSSQNFERQTRAADYSVSRVDVSQLGVTISNVQDDKDVTTADNWVSTQGYQVSRIDPFAPTTFTDKNYDSMVTSLTSPGFHALSMDDRQENCRIRLRTSAGHQIIMDDTNERIYISTAKGENWIELDQNGNIDVYSGNKINLHSTKTINISSDEDVRIYGKTGVHIKSDQQLNLDASDDINVSTKASLRVASEGDAFIESGSVINVLANGNLDLTSNANVNILGSGNILATASEIHMNGPGAEPAGNANAQPSSFPSRIPQHEPWPRGMTKGNNTMDSEFAYDDPRVNREERGTVYTRGYYWRR